MSQLLTAPPTDGDIDDVSPVVACRLPKPLHDQVKAACKAGGMSASRFIRETLQAAFDNDKVVIKPVPPVPAKMKELTRDMYRLFASVANNTNQLAKRVHYDHLNDRCSDKTYAAVAEQLAILNRVMVSRLPP
ncbi:MULTISPECIES: hypothetical protein [Noviherbaspirillum]|uniref:hypothetical protein n=1 Tax=Noviherbaspirillum TaxID=1344552 RepID=UPI00124BDA41|nr:MULTISPECIES: hypothetical protein [Noviherbaspirillum]